MSYKSRFLFYSTKTLSECCYHIRSSKVRLFRTVTDFGPRLQNNGSALTSASWMLRYDHYILFQLIILIAPKLKRKVSCRYCLTGPTHMDRFGVGEHCATQ
jgi:hypothetical protein